MSNYPFIYSYMHTYIKDKYKAWLLIQTLSIVYLLIICSLIDVTLVMTLDSLHVQSVPLSEDFTLFESLATYVLLLLLSVWTSVSRQFIYNSRIWPLEIALHVNSTTLPACNGKSLSVVIKGPLISANGNYLICSNWYSQKIFSLQFCTLYNTHWFEYTCENT